MKARHVVYSTLLVFGGLVLVIGDIAWERRFIVLASLLFGGGP